MEIFVIYVRTDCVWKILKRKGLKIVMMGGVYENLLHPSPLNQSIYLQLHSWMFELCKENQCAARLVAFFLDGTIGSLKHDYTLLPSI